MEEPRQEAQAALFCEYLETLDEAAFGAASEVQPKFTSHSDPASQWTAANARSLTRKARAPRSDHNSLR